MIRVLRIQSLAVVEELELELAPGLNVITGETGAGKSMLVKSLELLRGARGAPHLLRTGAERAVVEALVEEGDATRVVRRVVSRAGRSRAYLDGEMCTVQALQEHARGWLDISSQHEHHTLTDPASHLAWLDRFAGHEDLLARLATAVEAAREASRTLATFRSTLAERLEKADLFRFQLAEIDRVAPKAGELDAVLEELDVLTHAEALQAATVSAATAIHEGDRSAVSMLARATTALQQACTRDPRLAPLLERLESAVVEVEDIAGDLMVHASRLDPDPHRIAELTERERVLSRLVRRHGTLEAALAHRDAVEAQLAEIEDAEGTESALATSARKALEAASALAREVSAARKAHADRLAAAVTEELASLGMGAARIAVSVGAVPAGEADLAVGGSRLGSTGIDRAEFLIAPNPGEEPRPLSQVASGGELSRALLALKQVLAGLGPVSTYVFDEVDTGVGGAVAEAIGRKLHEVARHHQVVCITHQAVIAAWADHHLVVHKEVVDGRTRTSIRALTDDERHLELARMMGGADLTPGVHQAARELLSGARS
ncbi:MAG: DNA repair protein RecN [Alphaproteobacteria bacterium]|nr:DNA repair protein RecN [Alphaproteobacteria bacterium]MCB9690999.1 DNA repair protein RecN [Alphaproteobacteria bacterium]